jgi:hypothetical protein
MPARLIALSGVLKLASCYVGGAIATELSHDALTANPFIPIVRSARFVRDRSIFF